MHKYLVGIFCLYYVTKALHRILVSTKKMYGIAEYYYLTQVTISNLYFKSLQVKVELASWKESSYLCFAFNLFPKVTYSYIVETNKWDGVG